MGSILNDAAFHFAKSDSAYMDGTKKLLDSLRPKVVFSP